LRRRPFRVREAAAGTQFECGSRRDFILRSTPVVTVMARVHKRWGIRLARQRLPQAD